MKPLPPPNVPGIAESDRMSNALRIVLQDHKVDLLKKEAQAKRANVKKRANKKPVS